MGEVREDAEVTGCAWCDGARWAGAYLEYLTDEERLTFLLVALGGDALPPREMVATYGEVGGKDATGFEGGWAWCALQAAGRWARDVAEVRTGNKVHPQGTRVQCGPLRSCCAERVLGKVAQSG